MIFPPSIVHGTGQQGTPDHPWSLFEGHAGLLTLYTDLVLSPHPETARFPAVEMGVGGVAGGRQWVVLVGSVVGGTDEEEG